MRAGVLSPLLRTRSATPPGCRSLSLPQDGPCRGRTHAGAQCVDGCLQRLGRGHARAVAQQHLLGHIQQFGVEGALGLGQQVLHSPARVATQALRHRDFGRLVDPLQAVAHQLAVRTCLRSFRGRVGVQSV